MKTEMKRYRVRLEYHQKETVDVEAETPEEAEKKAMEEVSVGLNAYLYDSSVEVKP